MVHLVAKIYPSSLGKSSFNTNFKFPIKKKTNTRDSLYHSRN